MKKMIASAVVALSLGTGAAYAAGAPVGFQEPVYGSQASSDHSHAAAVDFLGRDTVLGKMFHYSNSNAVAAIPSTKG